MGNRVLWVLRRQILPERARPDVRTCNVEGLYAPHRGRRGSLHLSRRIPARYLTRNCKDQKGAILKSKTRILQFEISYQQWGGIPPWRDLQAVKRNDTRLDEQAVAHAKKK